MATTPRGYPIFTGSAVPAGPVQMQQLAEAIDTDMEKVATPGTWTPANLLGSWVTAAGYPAPRHRLDRGTVELQGRVNGGTADILVLPVGRRPTFSGTEPLIFPCDNTTGAGRVAVYPDGRVTALQAPTAPGMSINLRFSI